MNSKKLSGSPFWFALGALLVSTFKQKNPTTVATPAPSLEPQRPKSFSLWIEFFMLIITALLAYQGHRSLSIVRKQSIGEMRPLIDVNATTIYQYEGSTQTAIMFSITNYSGFTARNIRLDLKARYSWLGEWMRARNYGAQMGKLRGAQKGVNYLLQQPIVIEKLDGGETKKRNVHFHWVAQHALDLEGDVCQARDSRGVPVQLRVSWENDEAHVFDEVRKFRLLCTTDRIGLNPGNGRAFTWMPDSE